MGSPIGTNTPASPSRSTCPTSAPAHPDRATQAPAGSRSPPQAACEPPVDLAEASLAAAPERRCRRAGIPATAAPSAARCSSSIWRSTGRTFSATDTDGAGQLRRAADHVSWLESLSRSSTGASQLRREPIGDRLAERSQQAPHAPPQKSAVNFVGWEKSIVRMRRSRAALVHVRFLRAPLRAGSCCRAPSARSRSPQPPSALRQRPLQPSATPSARQLARRRCADVAADGPHRGLALHDLGDAQSELLIHHDHLAARDGGAVHEQVHGLRPRGDRASPPSPRAARGSRRPSCWVRPISTLSSIGTSRDGADPSHARSARLAAAVPPGPASAALAGSAGSNCSSSMGSVLRSLPPIAR